MASRRLFDGASEEIGQLPIVAAAVDQTWTGTDATIAVTATSGEFSASGGSPQTWTGTDATATVTATSGSWSQTGPITRPLTPTTGAGTGTAVGSFVVTDPGAIDTNDVVIVAVTSRRDRTITTPTGWNVLGPVQAGNTDNTGNNLYVFWRRGEPSTWTFTLSSSSSGWAWVCDVFRGCITSGDPWFSTATNSGTDASVEVSALSSLPPGCMAIGVAGYSDSSGAGGTPTTYGTDPSGWASTSSFNSSNQQGALLGYDDLVSGTSVAQATWTLDQAPNNWTSRMLALSPQQVTWAGTDGTVTVTATSGEFSATTTVTGTISATEDADTSSIAGIETFSGTIAAGETADTSSISGSETFPGTIGATEAADTSSFAGSVDAANTIGATEAADTAAFFGTVTISGTIAATEAADTSSISGTQTFSGTIGATEAADTSSISGTVSVDATGTLGATEAADTASLTGATFPNPTGTIGLTEASDTGALAGTLIENATGTAALIELADTVAFSGVVANPVTGTIGAIEVTDIGYVGAQRFGKGRVEVRSAGPIFRSSRARRRYYDPTQNPVTER